MRFKVAGNRCDSLKAGMTMESDEPLAPARESDKKSGALPGARPKEGWSKGQL